MQGFDQHTVLSLIRKYVVSQKTPAHLGSSSRITSDSYLTRGFFVFRMILLTLGEVVLKSPRTIVVFCVFCLETRRGGSTGFRSSLGSLEVLLATVQGFMIS